MSTRDWNAAVDHLERRQKEAASSIWGATDAVTDAVLAVELDGAPAQQLEDARAHLALLQNQQRELAAALVVAQNNRARTWLDEEAQRNFRRQELAVETEARGWDPSDFIQALREFGMSEGGVPGSLSGDATRLMILFGRYVDEPGTRDARARAARDRLHGILASMNTGSATNARAAIKRLCSELEGGSKRAAA